MLDQLPTEIVHHIASHLPTASSIIKLSLTNRKLHAQISGDDYTTFRLFVQRYFPTIRTPSYWKEAACILTTRSRAWDRRAFFAKALDPPADQLDPLYHGRERRPSIGYTPVIDSYETWYGSRWADKHEVLAWGAAGRLMMRVNEPDSTIWHAHKACNDHLPQNDILDVRLVRPNQRKVQMGEEVIIRRANNEITKLKLNPERNCVQDQMLFDTRGLAVDCMDVSLSSRPLVAACNRQFIHFFDGNAGGQLAQPIYTLITQQNPVCKHRKRCAKFLDSERFAVGVQYLERQNIAPINIYRITPDGSATSPEQCLPCSSGDTSSRNRINANAIIPLDDVSTLRVCAGELFLSGWSDGIIRLYDLRAPIRSSIDFQDGVDDGQIVSLLSIGHERFLAGSLESACLKTFDLRMPGAKVYSYLDARSLPSAVSGPGYGTSPKDAPHIQQYEPANESKRRQINIFLAVRIQRPMKLWQPLPKQQLTHLPRYRGAVYSLSAPSPASPTVYAGIENHVLQLDFVSTDDIKKGRQGLSAFGLDVGKESKEQMLNLSCYERPRSGHESTDTLLLRNQVSCDKARLGDGLAEDGWDERWPMPIRDRTWRRNNPAL